MKPADVDIDGLLKRLHLANSRRCWRDLVQRAESEQWSLRDFLAVLVAEEVAQRQQTRVQRLVARGRDHAAAARPADDDREPGKLRPIVLLHRRVERVHVHVQDRAFARAHESVYMAYTSPASIVMASRTT